MSGDRLVVFDVDGTLIDSQHLIVAAMERAFDLADLIPPSRSDILGIVGLSLHEAMIALAPHLAETETLALAEHYREGFIAQRAAGGPGSHAPLYPGARAALDRLSAVPGTRLGIATGKARPGLDHVFATHDIGRLFVTTQTADAHPSKPHPSMLLRALADTGCAAGRSVMIGDTAFDIEMGRSAGFFTIAVTWGYHSRARLETAGADLFISSYDELDDALVEIGVGA